MIKFTIHGKPIALKRHRVSKNGRMYDPSYKDKKQIWLQIAQFKPKRPLTGDIFIKLIFYMPRPKHHYRTGKYSHLLKDRCKDIIYHSVKPDLDNLVKLICDTIQGKDRIIHDDSQICIIQAEKKYGDPPRTVVIVEEI
tara:strand:- start:520 stop:936 length:417 start_codon:yes stop_codon:yes gene_type:complete